MASRTWRQEEADRLLDEGAEAPVVLAAGCPAASKLLGILGPSADAEDALAAAWSEAWERTAGGEQIRDLPAWLLVTARRILARDRARSTGPRS